MYMLFRVVVLCSVLGGIALAAPIPWPRPWSGGWDAADDPLLAARYERNGPKLRVVLRGPSEVGGETRTTQQRTYKGDFQVTVCVRGSMDKLPKQEGILWGAGLQVTDGTNTIRFLRTAHNSTTEGCRFGLLLMSTTARRPLSGLPASKAGFLHLRRCGDGIDIWCSEDGEKWVRLPHVESRGFNMVPDLPPVRGYDLKPTVKVGVVVEAHSPGTMTAEFSRFTIEPLKVPW